jgi:hypothetical protein
MKKPIKDLTNDEANRCAAVELGWTFTLGEVVKEWWHGPEGLVDGERLEGPPDIIGDARLWWELLKKLRAHLEWFRESGGLVCISSVPNDQGGEYDIKVKFMDDEVGRAVVLCFLMLKNPSGEVEVP